MTRASRVELVTALAWFALGAAIVVASWRMDRLGHLAINPWSAPGLTPGAIGVLIMVFAVAIGVQALRGGTTADSSAGSGSADAADAGVDSDRARAADAGVDRDHAGAADAGAGSDSADASPPAGSARRTLIAGALCVLFAGVTLGRGVPFVVEGTVFVAAFTAIFSWSTWHREQRVARGLAQTLAIAVVACLLISWLFERVFLVRLP